MSHPWPCAFDEAGSRSCLSVSPLRSRTLKSNSVCAVHVSLTRISTLDICNVYVCTCSMHGADGMTMLVHELLGWFVYMFLVSELREIIDLRPIRVCVCVPVSELVCVCVCILCGQSAPAAEPPFFFFFFSAGKALDWRWGSNKLARASSLKPQASSLKPQASSSSPACASETATARVPQAHSTQRTS